MHLHGIVMTATLEEDPADPDRVEMHLLVQGVGPGQPRKLVVPMEILVAQPDIEPESIRGHAFEAEVREAAPKRWITDAITFMTNRVLRPEP